VALCLAGLFLLGVWQLTPLPAGALDRLSPATVRLCRQLLPATAEEVVAGEAPDTDRLFAGSAVSVYPAGTRAVLVQVLAVLALFAVVRNNVASAASLRRLALLALVNGALLAVFAVLQFFTSPRHLVYWSIPSQGAVFGPFINKNHFACYINLCLGLGLGLLPGTLAAAPVGGPHRAAATSTLWERPGALWAVWALALMLAASLLCLSRGGLLALLAAAVPCLLLLLARRRSGVSRGWLAGLLVAAVALGLVAWLGLGPVQARLATLWKGKSLEEGRWPLWTRVLPLAADFPVWGAGYGTFPYLEPLRRGPDSGIDFTYDHAHNDYLEMLLEGGAVGLGLTLLAAGLVYGLGARAYLRQRGGPEAGLILGTLFGLGAVLAHSIGDFGLHVPAITLLATVAAAQLCALGARRPSELSASGEAVGGAAAYTLRLVGLAPVLGAAALVLVGLTLTAEAWRAERAERYRLAAARCKESADPATRDRQRTYLRAAAALVPEDATLQLRLADAYHDEFERREAAAARR
jgi:O-antigen ligase